MYVYISFVIALSPGLFISSCLLSNKLTCLSFLRGSYLRFWKRSASFWKKGAPFLKKGRHLFQMTFESHSNTVRIAFKKEGRDFWEKVYRLLKKSLGTCLYRGQKNIAQFFIPERYFSLTSSLKKIRILHIYLPSIVEELRLPFG